jgi:hypothetical protein
MMRKMRKTRNTGQNITEAAVIFAIIVGVFASMQLYLKRSLNVRYKAGADYMHEQLRNAAPAFAGLPRQYDPYYTESLQEDTKTSTTLTGYPDSSVNDRLNRRVWAETDIPTPTD